MCEQRIRMLLSKWFLIFINISYGCLEDLKLYKSSAYEDNKNNAISEIEILDDNNKEIHNISKILFKNYYFWKIPYFKLQKN